MTKAMLLYTLIEQRINCEDNDDINILDELILMFEKCLTIDEINKMLRAIVTASVFNVYGENNLITEEKIELWYNQIKNYINS